MREYIITDQIVNKAIQAIDNENKENDSLDMMLVGGMAVQAHINEKKLYRSTNDIDIATSRVLKWPEFRDFVGEDIKKELEEEGYKANLNKSHYSHEIRSEGNNGEFFVHISRYTNSYWDRNKDWKLREIENASEMQIPGSDHEILTVGIEDILATKADRINQLEEKGYVDGKYREHWKEFLSGNLERLKESDDIYREKGRIDGMRNALSLIPKEKFRENIDKVNRYKVKKDIYDMKILLNEKDIEKEIDKVYLAFATKEQGVENEII